MPEPIDATKPPEPQGTVPPGTADAGAKKPEGSTQTISEREAYLESENKKLIAERDAAKKKAREADERILAENNEFKKLFEAAKPELETLRQRVSAIDERTKAKLATEEKKLTPEDKTEYDSFISKLSEDDRLEWISARLSSRQSPPSSSPGSGARPTGDGKTVTQENFNGMSPLEKAAFFAGGGKIA